MPRETTHRDGSFCSCFTLIAYSILVPDNPAQVCISATSLSMKLLGKIRSIPDKPLPVPKPAPRHLRTRTPERAMQVHSGFPDPDFAGSYLQHGEAERAIWRSKWHTGPPIPTAGSTPSGAVLLCEQNADGLYVPNPKLEFIVLIRDHSNHQLSEVLPPSSPMNASGALSGPSATSSRYLIFPMRTMPKSVSGIHRSVEHSGHESGGPAHVGGVLGTWSSPAPAVLNRVPFFAHPDGDDRLCSTPKLMLFSAAGTPMRLATGYCVTV
jgi:hypothetical protein